jgi:hypothetical protein
LRFRVVATRSSIGSISLIWLCALFFVQRDVRQSRSLMIEWQGTPSLSQLEPFPKSSALSLCVPTCRSQKNASNEIAVNGGFGEPEA